MKQTSNHICHLAFDVTHILGEKLLKGVKSLFVVLVSFLIARITGVCVWTHTPVHSMYKHMYIFNMYFWKKHWKSEYIAMETSRYLGKSLYPNKMWPYAKLEHINVFTVLFGGGVYGFGSVHVFCLTADGSSFVLPDCPGGGAPDDPRGRQRKTVRTAARFPAHGSMAMGLGAPWKRKLLLT